MEQAIWNPSSLEDVLSLYGDKVSYSHLDGNELPFFLVFVDTFFSIVLFVDVVIGFHHTCYFALHSFFLHRLLSLYCD